MGGSSRVGIARSGSDLADMGGSWRLSRRSGYDVSPMVLGSGPEEVETYALPTALSPPAPPHGRLYNTVGQNIPL